MMRASPFKYRVRFATAWVFAGWLVFAGEPTSAPETLAGLRERLVARASEPRFARAYWGIHIVSLETGRTLFSANADKAFLPASTAKLFTTALALDCLGPDFRVRTSLYAATRPDARGTLKGDLILYGRGDAGFSVSAVGGDWDRALAPLVDALKAAGVKQVTGDLVADESYFRGPAIGSGWEYDDLRWYYGAEISALTVNDNAIDVHVRPAGKVGSPAEVFLFPATRFLVVSNLIQTVATNGTRRIDVNRPLDGNVVWVKGTLPVGARGATESISVHRPAAWFGEELKQALQRGGITVQGHVRVVNAAEREAAPLDLNRLVELGATMSAPLSEELARTLKPSQNLHAELLLFQAGAAGADAETPGLTSEQAGLRALAAFLAKAGLAPDEVRLEEGSGLSRHDLVTPRALVGLLQFMARHPQAKVFHDALPIAGVDGTLRTRMRGTPAEGNLRAKTGSLSLVNTLAGYVTTAAGEPLAFALLLNNYPTGAAERPGRAELDDVAVWLASLAQHTRDAPGN